MIEIGANAVMNMLPMIILRANKAHTTHLYFESIVPLSGMSVSLVSLICILNEKTRGEEDHVSE